MCDHIEGVLSKQNIGELRVTRAVVATGEWFKTTFSIAFLIP